MENSTKFVARHPSRPFVTLQSVTAGNPDIPRDISTVAPDSPPVL